MVSAQPGPPGRFAFAIDAQSTQEALIALALQADISIGGGSECGGRRTRLSGRHTVEGALKRLLAGSGCRYQFIDAHTVRVFVAPPRRQRPVGGGGVQSPAPATSPAPGSPDEVVISAVKRPGFAGSFAGAPSVISGAVIDETGASDTADVARLLVGVTTTNLGPARNKILLRGLSDGAFTGRTQSTVGTYLDAVPVNYNAPDPDLGLADVERVEILRGPQGALYGGGSLSGIYRIVTRKPRLDETTAALRVQGGPTQGGAPSVKGDLVINAPLIAGAAATRVVLYEDRQGGYLQDDTLRLSNVDLSERYGGRATVRWLIGDQWTVDLSTAVQHLTSADTQYVTPAVGAGSRSNQVRETHRNTFAEAALAVAGAGDWGRLESSTAVVRHSFASRYDASAAVVAFGGSTADDVGVFDETSFVRLLTEDLYWSSPEGDRLHLLTGLYGSVNLETSPSSLSSRSSSGSLRNLYGEHRRDAITEGAAYGEASYDLGTGWTIAAGARLAHTRVHTVSLVQRPFSSSNPTRSLDLTKGFNGLSPKISLQKQWPNGAFVYALASTDYRAGGFNTGGLQAPSSNIADFAPDRLQNYEVGGAIKLLDGRLNLRSALFYDHWDDIQTDQYLPSGISYTANVGDGRNLGWEAELTFQVTDAWRLQAIIMLDRPTVTQLNPQFAGIVGARLPGVPDVDLGASTSWRHALKPDLTFVATAEGSFTGESRLTFDSRFSPVTPSHYDATLSAQLVWPKTRAALYVSNPLNSHQNTFSYGNPFSFGQVRQVTPQRPRTISLMVARDY